MARRIVLIQGHPDPAGNRLCHGLADAYAAGATTAGHALRRIDVAQLDFPLLRTQAEFEHGVPPQAIAQVQKDIEWAEHLVIIYPLWLGALPALLKAFFEQALRPGFAFRYGEKGGLWHKKLGGRSARIVVSMGMPALAYRWWYGAHSLKALERNILGFVGFGPIRHTLIGMVDGMSAAKRLHWLDRMRDLGQSGA